MTCRIASHAGSWYSDNRNELNEKLSAWLSEAKREASFTASRAIISPHAGYSYCGACAAYAYKQLNPDTVKRIFILGPSHHVYLPGCALSCLQTYKTPLSSLKIDQEVYRKLRLTNQFTSMTKEVDEDEHSIEMQLPYLAKVMEHRKDDFTIVPILVGSLNREAETLYGNIFSEYLGDPENFFVISSDFCHWGRRFKYNHYDRKHGKIYQSIEHLDKMGMKHIEDLDYNKFHSYLKEYGNTICGRHPIGVLLSSVEALHRSGKAKFNFKFLDYRQSNKCQDNSDSSVSYAAGMLVAI